MRENSCHLIPIAPKSCKNNVSSFGLSSETFCPPLTPTTDDEIRRQSHNRGLLHEKTFPAPYAGQFDSSVRAIQIVVEPGQKGDRHPRIRSGRVLHPEPSGQGTSRVREQVQRRSLSFCYC